MPGSWPECEISAADIKLECQVPLATENATNPKSTSPQDSVILQGSEMRLDHNMATGKAATSPTVPLQEILKTQSSAAPTTREKIQSNKSLDPRVETSTAKKSFLEYFCAFLFRLINIPLTAAENIAKDKNLILLLLVLAVGAGLWFCLAWVDRWAASSVAPVKLAWTGVSTTFNFLLDHITKLGHIVPEGYTRITNLTSTLGSSDKRGGMIDMIIGLGELVADPSTYKNFLCPSQVGLCLIPWLSLCCLPASRPNSTSASVSTTSLDVFNKTNIELGYWAGVTVSLGPYINDFQMSSVPLARERFLLGYYKGIDFEGKEDLLSDMLQYRDELYNSSQCLFNITLHTDRILKVMVSNFKVAARVVNEAMEVDEGWWGLSRTRKSQVNDRIVRLLDVLDEELLSLVANIDVCRETLVKTVSLSQGVDAGLMTAKSHVKQQIQKGSGLFKKPNEDLYAVNQILLGTTNYAADEVQEKLEIARMKLGNHRRDVLNAKETIDLSMVLASKDGMSELVSILRAVFSDLSNERGKVEIAQTNRREAFEQKSIERATRWRRREGSNAFRDTTN